MMALRINVLAKGNRYVCMGMVVCFIYCLFFCLYTHSGVRLETLNKFISALNGKLGEQSQRVQSAQEIMYLSGPPTVQPTACLTFRKRAV